MLHSCDVLNGYQSLIDPITMAAQSSTGSPATVVLQPIYEKLARSNHTTWHAQVLATLWGARLEGFVTNKKKASTALPRSKKKMAKRPSI
jgi:hypothetical protein